MIDYASLVTDYNATLSVSTSRTLLYGAAGSGKTKLASTWPSPFFIDADRGMRSIDTTGKIKYMRLPGYIPTNAISATNISSFELVMNILKDAKNGTGEFAPGKSLADRDTLVIDGISALVDEFFLKEIMLINKKDPTTDKAGFDEYGQLKNQLVQLGMLIKDVSDKKYVVVTALIDEEKDALTGAIEGKPLMTGKYRDMIGGVFDEEYYMESLDAGGGIQKYMMYAARYKWYEAKTRLLGKNRLDVSNRGFDLIKDNYRIGGTVSVGVKPATVVAGAQSSSPTNANGAFRPAGTSVVH